MEVIFSSQTGLARIHIGWKNSRGTADMPGMDMSATAWMQMAVENCCNSESDSERIPRGLRRGASMFET